MEDAFYGRRNEYSNAGRWCIKCKNVLITQINMTLISGCEYDDLGCFKAELELMTQMCPACYEKRIRFRRFFKYRQIKGKLR
jgi:hypothetical protein